jgi:hypothetical protein
VGGGVMRSRRWDESRRRTDGLLGPFLEAAAKAAATGRRAPCIK